MSPNHKKILYIGIGVAAAFLFFFAGASWGIQTRIKAEAVEKLFGNEISVPTDTDFTLLLKAWSIIDEKYVGDEKPTNQERLWGSIAGLIASVGDPYTAFFPPQEAKIFSQDIEGNFGGVGIELGTREGILTVIAPLKDSPADRVGIRAGDKIIEVDGKQTAQITVDEALLLIRGKIGEKVTLKIFRENSKASSGGETLDFTIVRDEIKIPTLETERAGDVFVINLFNFNAQAGPLFEKALREFNSTGGSKLLIDLRGNPGGFLEAAIDMASFFVPGGKLVVTEDFGSDEESVEHLSKGFNLFTKQPQVVLLVDEGSASAAEIFAAALQEQTGAQVVGAKTFGKGSVQELVPLTNDTFIKITVARWLTPKGVSISEGGITPNHIVEITEEDIDAGRDPQRAKALLLFK
jgi:carboxyl-terminal processing protease